MDIVVDHLTKRYRPAVAVDDLSFTATAGRVTGFVGPNRAGKTTTLRALLGLVEPTRGIATIGGRRLRELDDPGGTVGALLHTHVGPPGRPVRTHLAITSRLIGATGDRVDAVLDQVGLTSVGRRRIGALSTGMRQRLGLAVAALVGLAVAILAWMLVVGNALPTALGFEDATRFVSSRSASAVVDVARPEPETIGALAGLGVLGAISVVAVTIGIVAFERRDVAG